MSERCPNCGGLNAPDAKWCGQCFEPLRGPEAPAAEAEEAAALLGELAAPAEPPPDPAAPAEPPPAPPEQSADPAERAPESPPQPARVPGPATEASPFQVRDDGLVWICSMCEGENPMEAQACLRCGTPFRALFRQEREAPEVDPGRATALSLIFPGLGHLAAGRRIDGLARMLIFAWLLGTLVVIVASRAGRGLGPLLGLVAVYFASAGALYLLSAVDARRAAEGDDPIVSSRILLYGVSALLLLTILLLFLTGPSLGG